jgi:hypothetical protein
VTRVVVTRPDGIPTGLFFAVDVNQTPGAAAVRAADWSRDLMRCSAWQAAVGSSFRGIRAGADRLALARTASTGRRLAPDSARYRAVRPRRSRRSAGG